MEFKFNIQDGISAAIAIFVIVVTNFLTAHFFDNFLNASVLNKCIMIGWYTGWILFTLFLFFSIQIISHKITAWLKFKKNWYTSLNHAWDESGQARCIVDGQYVHLEKKDDGIFYSTCMKCKHTKALIDVEGNPTAPSKVVMEILKRKQNRNHNHL